MSVFHCYIFRGCSRSFHDVTKLTCFAVVWRTLALADKILVSYFHRQAAHASLILG